jgi:hypothetical protein
MNIIINKSNNDVKVIVNPSQFIEYLCKYVFKKEKKNDVVKHFAKKLEDVEK